MKKLAFIILLYLISVHLQGQTEIISKNDSISFLNFLEKFKNTNLPLDFSLVNTFYTGEKIDKGIMEKYLCDFCNFCYNTFDLATQQYYYSFKIQTNKSFFIIVYVSKNSDQLTKHSQFILVTYSKKDYKRIGKIVLWGTKEARYLIYSKIDTDLVIESTIIYTYENDDNPYKDKEIFRIEEIKSQYHIDDYGNIIKISESLPIEYPAKFDFNKNRSVHYIYPVEIKDK